MFDQSVQSGVRYISGAAPLLLFWLDSLPHYPGNTAAIGLILISIRTHFSTVTHT